MADTETRLTAETKTAFKYTPPTEWYAACGIAACKECGEVPLVDLDGLPFCPIAKPKCQGVK